MHSDPLYPSHSDIDHPVTRDWAGSDSLHSRTTGTMPWLRANPLPLALIGVGIGWLALSGTGTGHRIARSARETAGPVLNDARERLSEAAETVRDTAAHTYEKAGESVSSLRRAAMDMAERTGATARDYTHQASHRGSSATDGFWDMVHDHPLVAGLMAMGLGAAIGASLPASRVEDRWAGSLADDTAGKIKAVAEDALERGSRAARAAAESAREELVETADSSTTASPTQTRPDMTRPDTGRDMGRDNRGTSTL